MPYQNYFWDFDGTLADSYPHTTAAFCEILKEDGRSVDPAAADRLLRQSLLSAYEAYALTPAQIDRFLRHERRFEVQPPVVLYPHAAAVLQTLHDRGCRQFLVTHRDAVAADYLTLFGLRSFFADIVTRDDGFPHKPDPACLNYLHQKYGLDPAASLMIGDRELDVLCGQNAGVHSCLFVEKGEAPPSCATFVVRDLRQILSL